MGKYVVRDREAGNVIETFNSREEAYSAMLEYEKEDEREGVYEPDFYEVVER